MKKNGTLGVLISLLLILGFGIGGSFSQSGFDGKWVLIPEQSTEIGLYETLSLEFQATPATFTLIQTWGNARGFSDTLHFSTQDEIQRLPIKNRVFPTNVFMGISMSVGSFRTFTVKWENQGSILKLDEVSQIRSSQGLNEITCRHIFSLKAENNVLRYRIERSSRQTGPPIEYVFKKKDYRNAYYYQITDNWEIAGKLSEQALLISLQGIVNTAGPKFYLIYPEDWPFTFTQPVFDFYRQRHYFTFTRLGSLKAVLTTLGTDLKKYVVWDKNVRTSLIVAFTLAGLEKAVVVSEDLIPLVAEKGLKPVADFRGQFTGQSDAEIYAWAYQQYWARCNRELIIWLGGDAGNIMKPAVADWGIFKQVFFNDLSSKPADSLEYSLANQLLREMAPMSMVMGWHSYAKDRERDHIKLISQYGHRMEGLHTLPNMSFSSQVPASPEFVYKNNHHVVPGKSYRAGKKVYITCIQTDGIGLGAWNKPGRGQIPYAWEVTMNYHWMAPAMLEYFYTQATPNDYFIGCLSGPGYLYPKAVPADLLPPLIAQARDLMEKLDLRVFEIMDYSEGATVEGNTELPRDIVAAYDRGMPDAIGFVNGYAPAFTFARQKNRALVSYDYYLSPTRPVADAVADLQELAAINARRPYFLLVHVRESSDIQRVKSILDKLGPAFEVVPLDLFLTLAGQSFTFQERFLER